MEYLPTRTFFCFFVFFLLMVISCLQELSFFNLGRVPESSSLAKKVKESSRVGSSLPRVFLRGVLLVNL